MLVYNGVTLDLVQYREMRREVVYSDDGSEYLYTRFLVSVQGLYHSTWPGTQAARPVATDLTIRTTLMTPRRPLVVSFDNGTATPNVWLSSPLPGQVVDAKEGPHPISCDLTPGPGGDVTFVVDFTIETHVRECPDGGITSRVIIANQWQAGLTYNEDFMATYQMDGVAVFDGAVLRQAVALGGSGFADQFRAALFVPPPQGFQREQIQTEVSPDGLVIRYTTVDVEQAITFRPEPEGSGGDATIRTHGTQCSVVHIQNYTADIDLIGVAQELLGTAVNFSFLKSAMKPKKDDPLAGMTNPKKNKKGKWGP